MNVERGVWWVITLVLLITFIAAPIVAEKTDVTLTDILGRSVTVKVPIDTMALQWSGSGGPFYTLFALEGKDAAKKIAAMDSDDLKTNRYDIWEKFSEAVPELNSIPVIGSGKDLNPESIIAIKPDVVVAPKDCYNEAPDVYKKIEDAGIPVVTIDYHEEKLENHKKSIELMGKLLGKEEKANELFNYYKQQRDLVTSRLNAITKPKPRVYHENAMKSREEMSNSHSSKYMWGAIINQSRGDNIADGAVEKTAVMNEEYLLKKDPEVIIFTGSYWTKEPKSFRLGFTATNETAHDTLEPFKHRDGWESLSAIKNDRVSGVYIGIARDIMDFSAFQFAAKAIYPEEFKDVNPEQNLKDFYHTYMPLELSGVWMVEPDSPSA
nr:ABC transporter substrate-binding protein [uncultured Methanospirillum sp.]